MWTWISPNLEYKNQIDYFLAPTNSKLIKNFEVLRKFNFFSDHRPIKCTLNLENWRQYNRKCTTKRIGKNNEIDFKNRLERSLLGRARDEYRSVNEMNSSLKDFILTAAKATNADLPDRTNSDIQWSITRRNSPTY